MTSRSARRIPAIAGAAAIIALVGLSAACAKEEEKAPETSTTTTTTTTTTTPPPDRPRRRRGSIPMARTRSRRRHRTAGSDRPSGRQLVHRGAR